jgi:pyoverdine/dityrosine biosynthesis protein Dit1
MQVVESILSIFESFRMTPTAIDQYESVGKNILREKLTRFVIMNKPIDFVMLGFPFKSTNTRDKVLGTLPDRAELETMKNFARFNDAIKSVYDKGVVIHIASDGLIFNHILGVDDSVVMQYKEVSLDYANGTPLNIYDLSDFYEGGDLMSKRERLMNQFGITDEKLTFEVMNNPDVNFLYRGMSIFMSEEIAMNDYPSRNQREKAGKKLARTMMLWNEAYSNLVKQEFSDMIRLSMHPSINNGAKYSFQLIPSENAHHSAWHCALVVGADGQLSTMHKKDAIAAGHELVYQDNRPYYFQSK